MVDINETRDTFDAEGDALKRCAEALARLVDDPDALGRVLDYLIDRFRR